MPFDFADLLDAELDGVPFLVQAHRRRGGRRNVTHEFPGSERVQGEDVGRAPRRFVLEAFITGDDWIADRDALIEVLERPGPYLLVHPSYGEVVVNLDGEYDEQEDTSSAIARFSIPLVEHGTEVVPLVLAPPVPIACDAALQISQQRFAQKFKARNFLQSLLNGLRAANAALRKAKGKIDAAFGVIDDLAAEIDEFDDNLAGLLATPEILASKLVGLMASMYSLMREGPPDLARRVGDELDVFVIPEDRDDGTPRRKEHTVNLDAIELLFRTASVVELARTLEVLEYRSADDAAAARSNVVAKLNSLVELDDLSADDYHSLELVRASIARFLTHEAQLLPKIATFTVPTDTPAVVLAWRFHADAERGEELSDRNGLVNPLIVPAGTQVEVLQDGT